MSPEIRIPNKQPVSFFCSAPNYPQLVGFLRVKGGCVQGEGVLLGNPKDSVWEDWGTLGKIGEITTPPEELYYPTIQKNS